MLWFYLRSLLIPFPTFWYLNRNSFQSSAETSAMQSVTHTHIYIQNQADVNGRKVVVSIIYDIIRPHSTFYIFHCNLIFTPWLKLYARDWGRVGYPATTMARFSFLCLCNYCNTMNSHWVVFTHETLRKMDCLEWIGNEPIHISNGPSLKLAESYLKCP